MNRKCYEHLCESTFIPIFTKKLITINRLHISHKALKFKSER